MPRTSCRRWARALARCAVAWAALSAVPAVAEDAATVYNHALDALRAGRISPEEWRAIDQTIRSQATLRINPATGYAEGPGRAQGTAQAAPAGSGAGIAPAVPVCASQPVRDKALQAVYRDLSLLKMPLNSMQDVEEAVHRLAPSSGPQAQQARLNMSRAGRLPMDHIAACQPTNGHPLAVMVAMNPRQPSQWGVVVINYGLPNRAATLDLEFMN